MSAKPAQSAFAAPVIAAGVPAEQSGEARAPLCFVIDGDGSIRHFLSLILHGAGVDTEEFADGQGLLAALEKRSPDLVFLDVPLEILRRSQLVALGIGGYRGSVQLISAAAPRCSPSQKRSANRSACKCFRCCESRSRPAQS